MQCRWEDLQLFRKVLIPPGRARGPVLSDLGLWPPDSSQRCQHTAQQGFPRWPPSRANPSRWNSQNLCFCEQRESEIFPWMRTLLWCASAGKDCGNSCWQLMWCACRHTHGHEGGSCSSETYFSMHSFSQIAPSLSRLLPRARLQEGSGDPTLPDCEVIGALADWYSSAALSTWWMRRYVPVHSPPALRVICIAEQSMSAKLPHAQELLMLGQPEESTDRHGLS